MSKIEEMSLDYVNKQLKDAGVIDSNCPRELAITQASMMVNGYKAGANAVLEEIENILSLEYNTMATVDLIVEKVRELKG